jgi:hypothetical protein
VFGQPFLITDEGAQRRRDLSFLVSLRSGWHRSGANQHGATQMEKFSNPIALPVRRHADEEDMSASYTVAGAQSSQSPGSAVMRRRRATIGPGPPILLFNIARFAKLKLGR